MSDTTNTVSKPSGFAKVYGWVMLVVVVLLAGFAYLSMPASTSSVSTTSSASGGIVLP